MKIFGGKKPVPSSHDEFAPLFHHIACDLGNLMLHHAKLSYKSKAACFTNRKSSQATVQNTLCLIIPVDFKAMTSNAAA